MTDKPVSERATVEELRKAAHKLVCEAPDYAIWPRCEGWRGTCEDAHAAIDALADRLDQETEEVKKANAGFARLGGRLAGTYADLKCEMDKRVKAEWEVERQRIQLLRHHATTNADEWGKDCEVCAALRGDNK